MEWSKRVDNTLVRSYRRDKQFQTHMWRPKRSRDLAVIKRFCFEFQLLQTDVFFNQRHEILVKVFSKFVAKCAFFLTQSWMKPKPINLDLTLVDVFFDIDISH